MYLLSGVVHLVHDAMVKNATMALLFVLISASSVTVQAREIDLSQWQEMDDEIYQAILHGVSPGDTLIYKFDGVSNIFNIEARLKKAPGREVFSEKFLLDNQKILEIPSSIKFSDTLTNFVAGHEAFSKAGVNVVPLYPESHPPDFLLESYEPFISFRALLYLTLDNNAGFVTYELRRKVPEIEREEMKASTIKFIESLAAISAAPGFGIHQAVYALKSKKPMVVGFSGVPKLYDPGSGETQPSLIENWIDLAYSEQYGEDMEGAHVISLKKYRSLTNIIEQQRLQLSRAFRCNIELNLTSPKSEIPIHTRGPTGT